MRVISGYARGLKLDSVESDKVRPTTDRVKEALFSILQFEIQGKSFLDLFGGTGQIGIEAISRGAKEVVIVDDSIESLKTIKSNISKLKIKGNIKCIKSDALKFLDDTSYMFDIAFLDPPYKSEVLNKDLLKISSKMNSSGIIITETPIEDAVLEKANEFILCKRYKYGKIMLNIYKNENYIGGES